MPITLLFRASPSKVCSRLSASAKFPAPFSRRRVRSSPTACCSACWHSSSLSKWREKLERRWAPLAEKPAYYGSDARSHVAVTAKTAGINALINLVFLLVLGVDTPVVWSFLCFFLDFIPTLGFVIALVPPTFVTMLMYGWKRALLVAGGLILTNLIVDNVVTPIFMKHGVNVSFLDITLSLVAWAFVLGLAGAILAIPLTLALRKFVAKNSSAPEPAPILSG
jgi:predicted PurR-regulated permease PerM